MSNELENLANLRNSRRALIFKYPSLTVLLSTARPNDLAAILPQIGQQSLPSFSLFIGLHGFTLTPEHKRQIKNLEVRGVAVTTQGFSKDQTLGQVLTAMAEATTTEFIAKMDDDDIYGPEHLRDLFDALIANKAQASGKAMNYIYLEGIDITVRRMNRSGMSAVELWSDWVCGGTILANRKTAESVGFFGSGKSAVDKFLLTGIRSNGGKIWRTFGTGYIYKRNITAHTYVTNYSKYLIGGLDQWVGILKHPEFGTDEK